MSIQHPLALRRPFWPWLAAPGISRHTLAVLAGFAVLYLGWGSTFLANHLALAGFPSLVLAGLRFLLAGLLLAGLAWRRAGGMRLGWHDARLMVIGGVLMLSIGQGAMVYGVQHLPSGLAALVCTSLPLWTVVLQSLLPNERRPVPVVLFGLGLSVVGMAALLGSRLDVLQDSERLGAVVVLVLAQLAWAWGSFLFRRAGRGYSQVWWGMSAQMLLAGVILLGLAALTGQWQAFHWAAVSGDSAWALGYLVLVVTVLAYPVYFWLLRVTSPTLVSTFAFVAPLVAVALGVVVLGEALTTAMLGAAGLILLGVVAVTLGQRT